MKTFIATSKHTALVKHTVTKASDILIAICNRNDTYNIIGNRQVGNNREGYCVPVQARPMARIIGGELAFSFQESMGNPALKEYYDRICERLYEASIALAWSKEFWYINKLPLKTNEEMMRCYSYGMLQLINQQPSGFTVSEDDDVGKAY
jgi:hypothetical protein